MEQIANLLNKTKKQYDAGASPLEMIGDVACECLRKLRKKGQDRKQSILSSAERKRSRPAVTDENADLEGMEVIVPDKNYWVFYWETAVSRPFLPELFIRDDEEFSRRWLAMRNACSPELHLINLDVREVTEVIYTVITSFCLCFDLWKPTSRKTPGTFFEILMGSVLGTLLGGHIRGKSILISGQSVPVKTDMWFMRPDGKLGLVFPAKVTTRERIVQPFAHQRILESASVAGGRTYRSVLLCVSELQRDKDTGVKEICVPGPIRLYQQHLAKLEGIYYLDPPQRYQETDVSECIRVGSIGDLLTKVLPTLL